MKAIELLRVTFVQRSEYMMSQDDLIQLHYVKREINFQNLLLY